MGEPVDAEIFATQKRLDAFPPAKLLFILSRRLQEQGLRPTWLWLKDKIARQQQGFSPPEVSQVLPLLYVGGQHYSRGLATMRALGMGAILNLRAESDDAARGVALEHYLWLKVTDDTAPAAEELAQGADFIGAQIAAGRGVYIHCASGVGRAPTAAAAYLVTTGLSAAEAWATIRRVRPFIRPTPPQIGALTVWAEAHSR